MGYPVYNNVVNCISRVARVKGLISTVGILTSTVRKLVSLLITTRIVIIDISSIQISST